MDIAIEKYIKLIRIEDNLRNEDCDSYQYNSDFLVGELKEQVLDEKIKKRKQ